MAVLRWRRRKEGCLHLPGLPPRRDPHDRTRLLPGRGPLLLQFKADGNDGIYKTKDPQILAQAKDTEPWKRNELFIEGQEPAARPARDAPSVSASLPARLPYFEEPETLEDLLRVWQ